MIIMNGLGRNRLGEGTVPFYSEDCAKSGQSPAFLSEPLDNHHRPMSAKSIEAIRSQDAMPLYEYVCQACSKQFEWLARGGETPLCPQCGEQRLRVGN